MDVYTKVFLINAVVMLFVAGFDRIVLGDALEETFIVGEILGMWAVVTIISVPAWLVYLIAKM